MQTVTECPVSSWTMKDDPQMRVVCERMRNVPFELGCCTNDQRTKAALCEPDSIELERKADSATRE